MIRYFSFLVLISLVVSLMGQDQPVPAENQFRQMGTGFATPNAYRTASGAPGPLYWQQQVNYDIKVELDELNQRISGSEKITYINNSPDELTYLWVQLDQNVRQKDNLTSLITPSSLRESVSSRTLENLYYDFDGGFKIQKVVDGEGNPLTCTVNYTMMRIDLPAPLASGDHTEIGIDWGYNINDRVYGFDGRSGKEYYEKDGNYVFAIAQFFPRMAQYSDVEGWQNQQFTGRSEFALPFGDYRVEITVPADHVVGATGLLSNPEEVLSPSRLEKYRQAFHSYDKPIVIVSEQEAVKAEKNRSGDKKTWIYKAENVRDFAFASSRKFIWDAMGVKFGERTVLAASFYPKEGNPLWEKYSTRVVAHTLKVYSRHTFDYPYPVAQSVQSSRSGGMEYPMICFNGGRPDEDGTYSERRKWGVIDVIIHEVGHNFFPMILNSDERRFTWMDEGLNSFVEGIAEREWDHDHPSPRGRPRDVVDYMKGDVSNIYPIMTQGDLTSQLSYNAYAKPAAGMNILRETIMGRELFDFAFRQYAQRWMFKHPTPEDLFRTLEDASGMDLDWFWRGWFYGTDYVDISLEKVSEYVLASGNPADEKEWLRKKEESIPEEVNIRRDRAEMKSVVETDPTMRDFYDTYDPYRSDDSDEQAYRQYVSSLDDKEKEWIASGDHFYELDFSNKGGMVMPLILLFEFEDGGSELIRIPAEIWNRNNLKTSKVFRFDRKLKSVTLDPYLETADCDTGNNHWPSVAEVNRFEMTKRYRNRSYSNPMREQQKEKGR